MENSEISDNSDSRKRSRDDETEEETEEGCELSPKRSNNQGTVYFKILIPSSCAGAIIGKGGEAINRLQAETATNIKMSKGGDFFPGTTDRVCMVMGSIESIRQVNRFILEKIREKPDAGGLIAEIKAKIVVPESTATLIIGNDDEYINLIKETTNVFVNVSPKSTNAEKTVPERVVTLSGNTDNLYQAIDFILEKILKDPFSGSCTNVSYTDGTILPQSSIASLFANMFGGGNSTSTSAGTGAGSSSNTSGLHLPPGGTGPTMDALKLLLRARGFSDSATKDITAAMFTLASYGFLQLKPASLAMMQEWAATAAAAAAAAETTTNTTTTSSSGYYSQTADASSANAYQQYDNSYSNYYNYYGYNYGYYGMQDMWGYNSMGANGNNYSMAQGQGNYSMGQGNYSTGQGNYLTGQGNYSMGQGDYSGGMGNYSSGSTAPAPPPPSADSQSSSSVHVTQEVEIGSHVLDSIMGPEGKGVQEIQQWAGASLEIVQKSPNLHTVKIAGPPTSVQTALYILNQYIQHADYKQYYESQAANYGSSMAQQ